MKRKDPPKRLRIKEWEEDDRPREKMKEHGSNMLSNAELLAILIGSGNKNESAVELSQRILNHYDNRLELLSQTHINQLTNHFQGIGEAKAITILAALELSKRLSFSAESNQTIIKDVKDIYQLMRPDLAGISSEEAWVIFLNTGNRVITKKKMSTGGLNTCIFDIRLIIHEAIAQLACGIIMVHNHPSGRLEPSVQDKEITHKMAESCKICDIRLVDHVIVGNSGYFSFYEKGLLH
ncbi:MAG: DNA repair protein RadC [Paludibacteraceae bacterium]|nr:DNA repair protein RadC [Paludibacteraceae bacterium]